MNKITREILTEIMQSEEAWDPKTRKLRLNHINNLYIGEHESRYLDEIYFPRLQRAAKLCIALGFMTPDKLVIEENGDWWVDEDVSECLNDQLSCEGGLMYPIVPGLRSEHHYRASYFDQWWWGSDYGFEDITEEMCNEIDIKPTLVPAKEGQPALF